MNAPESLDQRQHDLGPHARRKWWARFEDALPGVVIFMLVVLTVLGVVSVIALTGLQKANAALDRQKLTSANGCERVQLLRDDQNVSAWGVYNALSLASEGQDPKSMAKVGLLLARVDAPTRNLITTLLAAGQANQGTYVRIREAQRYGPPTNCDVASKDPTYRFPRPIPFEAVADCYDPKTNPRPEKPCPHG